MRWPETFHELETNEAQGDLRSVITSLRTMFLSVRSDDLVVGPLESTGGRVRASRIYRGRKLVGLLWKVPKTLSAVAVLFQRCTSSDRTPRPAKNRLRSHSLNRPYPTAMQPFHLNFRASFHQFRPSRSVQYYSGRLTVPPCRI